MGQHNDKLDKLLTKKKINAKDHHLNFIAYTWKNASEAFVIGRHTREICTCIDQAIEKYRQGISTFWVISVPPRHGKSEIISRKLPAHFLGLFPDSKVILSGHTSDLVEGFSEESRDLIKTQQYQELFPSVTVSTTNSGASHWSIEGREGECFSCGISGSMAGQGGDLIIMDDFCRGRAEAESPTIREKTWNAFSNDFMTRRAPVSIVFVLATRWHVDDVIGRIENRMQEDPNFPRFEMKIIPAFSDDYPSGTLFPERFAKVWYEEQRAVLGEYGTASLLQQSPIIRGGNLLCTDYIQKHFSLEEYPEMQYYRIWDLAHTAKERAKVDPDYTSGTKLGFRSKPGSPRELELWIKDVKRVRMNAPERDNMIVTVTDQDGPYVKVGVENSMDAKDAYQTLKSILAGHRVVLSVTGQGDKVVRATPLEPIFTAGNVHVLANAPWLHAWLEEIAAFPKGAHDDQVDNLSAGYILCIKKSSVSSAPMVGV